MRRGSYFGQTAIAIATVALGTTGQTAWAQDPNSPVVVTLDLITDVNVDSNRNLAVTSPGTSTKVTENLSFGIRSETQTQVLNFTAGGGLRYLSTPGAGSDFDIDSPSLRLAYSRDVAESGLSFSASYRSSDVSNAFDSEDATSDDITPDTGTLVVYGAKLNYELGKNAPLGFSFNASYDNRNYSDTTDPDLFDNTSRTYGVSAHIRFSPVTRGTLSVDRTNSSSDNLASTEKESTSYKFATSHELGRALTLNSNIGYSQTDTTEFAATTTTEGLFGGIDAVQELPNGSVFGGIDFDKSDSDNSVSLTFGRSMDLRDGSVSASLTVTRGDISGTQYLGSLDYRKELANGAVTVDLSQSISTNADDEDVKFSKLGLGYTQALNSVSDLNLSLDLSRTEDGGIGSAIDKNRADFTATYSHELTKDWDVSVGYKHRRYREEGSSTATSNSVFMTLSRNIALSF